ncbi:MAG: LysM peptidoglycan-binding domain-containing protein [Oscillospiraceae bacterium]|jgi:hypothetical protein
MTLSPMRYGDYVWPHNPKTYEIDYKRRIVCHKIPFGLYVLRDMGREQRILRGEGEFVGDGAYDAFKKLASTFYNDRPQTLVHPVWQAAPAWFVELRLLQEPRKDYVRYQFEFWECWDGYELAMREVTQTAPSTDAQTDSGVRKSYTLRWGDTLWGLARDNGLTLSQLLALNPQIRNPNIYRVGDVIYLS